MPTRFGKPKIFWSSTRIPAPERPLFRLLLLSFVCIFLPTLPVSHRSLRHAAHAATFRANASWGWDDNVRETMEAAAQREDRFLRLLLEGSSGPLRSGRFGGSLLGRALTERYDDTATESRHQGEAVGSGWVELSGRTVLRIHGSAQGRTYPDSTERGFSRARGSAGILAPFGGGRVEISLGTGRLDYRRTTGLDRTDRFLSLRYRREIDERLDVGIQATFDWRDHGRAAIQQVDSTTFVLSGNQEDRGREAWIGARYLRGWFYELGLSWRSVRSNSFGYSVGRKAIEAAVTGWLPGRVLFQARARLEATSYHDADLDRVFLVRTGENTEAAEDNNRLLLRVRRSLGKRVAAEARLSWFRNESLLVGEFYEKRVGSIGLVWHPVGASDF
ncbi:MAG: hypothetical protein GF346_06845 [Candidatus Eisenbacteria bacterium]|nr:hypothetical protein [Candidatus Latescibacterota bacterium]MBD3302146.1 hypothetical protein [Candidatus Eisenbacteria bacterium]